MDDVENGRFGAPEDIEILVLPHGTLRAEQSEADFRPVLRGYAVVFDVLSTPIHERGVTFRERIRPEAIRRTLDERIDLRAFVDHDPSKILGRMSAGTLKVGIDKIGLRVEIFPPNTMLARDLVENVRVGNVDGMSFAYRVMPGGDEFHRAENGEVVRDVLDMRVREVSVVSQPAFEQTDVAVARRSLQRFLEREERCSLSALRAQHEAKLARWT